MGIVIIRNGKPYYEETSSQYTGDKIGGEFSSWDTITTDPNEFIKESYGILSDRNATLYQTSPHARACINKPLTYAIGDGITFKSAINHDFLGWTKKQAQEWSRRFTTLLHLEKMAAGWYENQAILFREASKCGDAILYFVRDDESHLPIELIVAGGHAIDWEHSTDNGKETPSGENWILGIRMDKFGRRKAFWQKVTGSEIKFKDEAGNQNAIQFLFQELAGQARGYGQIHSIIALIKQMDRVWDATVARMVLESVLMGYYNVDHTDVGAQMRGIVDAAKGNTAPSTEGTTATTMVRSNDMPPGSMLHLRNRESMTFSDIKTPSDNFGLANEWLLKTIAMARGYPPEFILGEYNTSYTAHKGALNDTIKKYMSERRQFVRAVERPINLEYLKYFARTGQIEVPPSFWMDHRTREALLEGTYLGPVPGHINPLQEVNADVKAVENSFTDHEAVARKHGRDWYNTVDEWAEQQKIWAEGSAEMQAEVMARQEAELARQETQEQEQEQEKEIEGEGKSDDNQD